LPNFTDPLKISSTTRPIRCESLACDLKPDPPPDLSMQSDRPWSQWGGIGEHAGFTQGNPGTSDSRFPIPRNLVQMVAHRQTLPLPAALNCRKLRRAASERIVATAVAAAKTHMIGILLPRAIDR
jgi:hypothetical protein